MQKTLHRRFAFLSAAVVVAVTLLAFCETSEAQMGRGRRMYRSRSVQPTQTERPKREPIATETAPSKAVASASSMMPDEAKKKLLELCEAVKKDAKSLTESDLEQAKHDLLKATEHLLRVVRTDRDRASASVWMERLALEALRKTLLDEDGPDAEVLGKTWSALHGEYKGILWNVFDPLRLSLRRYFRFQSLLNEVDGKKLYEIEVQRMCSNLPATIDDYSKNRIERQDTALSTTMDWLEDVSTVEPRAAEMAALARVVFSGVNIRVQVAADFLGAGFQTEIVDEVMEISENIQGTRVVGTGTFSATSSAALVETRDRAEIVVNVDSTLHSVTTGYNSPVTLNTKTTGTIKGEKRIVIAEDRIYTTPAKSSAQLESSIYNVRISAGPLVQGIARNQIQERQASSKAESRRRSEAKMNQRLNAQIDPRIAELNKNYHEKLREPLKKAGLFPRVWKLSSTAKTLDWAALIAELSQPSAMNPAPAIDKSFGLLVQIHQSAPNNAAMIALAGKYFDEDEFFKNLNMQFEKLSARTNRPEGEEPLRLTFASDGPIRLSFNDNKITALFQVHEFFLPRPGAEEGAPLQARRGLNIQLTYEIKKEKVKCDDDVERELVVLQQVGEPVLSPRPGDGERFSAMSNPTQTVVRRRLKELDSKAVLKPLAPEGEWEGKGLLVPSFASAEDGWLTFGWDWIPTKK